MLTIIVYTVALGTVTFGLGYVVGYTSETRDHTRGHTG